VEESQTFRQVMGVLLTIGNALNGTDLKAFQLDFLARASEVKGILNWTIFEYNRLKFQSERKIIINFHNKNSHFGLFFAYFNNKKAIKFVFSS
jgi:hypothetical protein